jgi:hypothetical protein
MDELKAAMAATKSQMGKRKRWQRDGNGSDDDDDAVASRFVKRGDLKRGDNAAAATAAAAAAAAAAATASSTAPPESTTTSSSSSLSSSTITTQSSSSSSSSSSTTPGTSPAKGGGGASSGQTSSTAEVKFRLRKLGEPITLFGETPGERWQRLKDVETAAHERSTSSSAGRLNDRKRIDAEIEAELRLATMQAGEAAYLDDDEKAQMEVLERERRRRERRAAKYSASRVRTDFATGGEYVVYWFQRMLREW